MLQHRLGLIVVVALVFSACPPPPAEGEGDEGEGEGDAGEGEGDAGEGEGDVGEGEGEGDAAPVVTAVDPADNAVDVATNAVLRVTWSEAIDCSTVVAGTVVVQLDSGAQLGASVTCANDGATFDVDPDADLPINSHITAGVVGQGTITDLGGTPMAANFVWAFDTGAGSDVTPPVVQTLFPVDDATQVSPNSIASATFDEPLNCATATTTTATLSDASGPIAAAVSCNGATITLDPNVDLAFNTVVTATIDGAVTDAAGNAVGSDVVWTFTTDNVVDTQAPAAPTVTAPASPTFSPTINVSGGKDAAEATSVEFSVAVDGGASSAFVERVAVNASTTWTANNVPLAIGVNVFTLRSKDAAGNVSGTATFTVDRDPVPVNAPVITQIVNTVSVARQVITGTKDAQTAVLLNGAVIVPQSASTTWDALVTVNAGVNVLNFTSRDGANNVSLATTESVTFTDPGAVPAGEVKIEFDVQSIWEQIGDETGGFTAGGSDTNHFSVTVWAEGPYADHGGAPEACVYDNANLQRRHTRHARTILHTAAEGACNFANTASDVADCQGFWADGDYREPDFFAALVETGRWASAANPLPAAVDRRNPAGHRFEQTDANQTYWFNTNQPRIKQAPVIDGVTQATLNAKHSILGTPVGSCNGACSEANDEHCVDDGSNAADPRNSPVECRRLSNGSAFSTCTGARPFPNTGGDDCGNGGFAVCDVAQSRCERNGTPVCRDGMIVVDVNGVPTCRGESLKDWHRRQTIRWNLSDANNQRVHAGWYVIWIALNADRAATVAQSIDVETCWDDPSQDDIGAHRVVAMVNVDGSTADVQLLDEKGLEVVNACSTGNGASSTSSSNPGGANRIACSCPAGAVWPCPETPNSGNGNVRFLDPTLTGQAGAVRVEYCPTAACP